MNSPRRPGRHDRPRPCSRVRPRRARAALSALAAAAILAAGCASFPDSAPSFTVQPSLTPNVATLVTPSMQPPSTRASTASSGARPPSTQQQTVSSGSGATDPCAPSAPPVIASCLDQPWGLAPLPDGASALVGERTTGKIFKVAPETTPELVATVPGVDGAGGGGLLGIALSPYYAEDGLVYAYVSTATDNRVVRIAPGQRPKAIFTGIPRGDGHNGGPIAFGTDGLLYVATGDAGRPGAGGDPASLAGKVLRLDTFGRPAGAGSGPAPTGSTPPATATTPAIPTAGTSTTAAPTPTTAAPTPTSTAPTPTSTAGAGGPAGRTAAVYASGLTDPTGICPLPGGRIGVVDHRGTADLLIPLRAGADYRHPASGDTLWVYQPGDGGGIDCAVSDGTLLATSLAAQKVTAIQMTPTGGFTGSPEDLIPKTFGRLRTIVTGPGNLVWLTTSNTDGQGSPDPSDDRVIVLPAGGGGGGGGGND